MSYEDYYEDIYNDIYEDVDPEDLAVFFPKEDLSSYEDPLSSGHRILAAVDTYLPDPISSLKMSITASCLVEDLSLLFPQLSIEICRATIGEYEAFVPLICDLQLFNSPYIGRFSESCVRIPDSAIIEGDVKKNGWYLNLLEEITDALKDYVSSLPLTVGNVSTGRTTQDGATGHTTQGDAVSVRSNFRFEIQPGEKQKVFTNFRLPSYKTVVTVTSPFSLKKKTFSSGELVTPPSLAESLEEISSLFPSGGLARPGKSKIPCSNAKVLEWVDEQLPPDFSDYCFEGLFSPQGERLKLTILNNTDEPIVIEEGEEIATFTKIESEWLYA